MKPLLVPRRPASERRAARTGGRAARAEALHAGEGRGAGLRRNAARRLRVLLCAPRMRLTPSQQEGAGGGQLGGVHGAAEPHPVALRGRALAQLAAAVPALPRHGGCALSARLRRRGRRRHLPRGLRGAPPPAGRAAGVAADRQRAKVPLQLLGGAGGLAGALRAVLRVAAGVPAGGRPAHAEDGRRGDGDLHPARAGGAVQAAWARGRDAAVQPAALARRVPALLPAERAVLAADLPVGVAQRPQAAGAGAAVRGAGAAAGGWVAAWRSEAQRASARSTGRTTWRRCCTTGRS